MVVEFEDEEGEGSISFGGGEIPDDFPVPVPDGGDVQQVSSTPDGASVSLFFPSDEFDSLKEFYSDWANGQSAEVSTFESTNPLAASWNFRDGQTDYNISLSDIGDLGIALNIVVTD